jgi:hypothetical protein
MALTKEQIARVQTEVPRWVELLKKQNVPDYLIPYCIAQIITETGWFNNKSYKLDRNPAGVTWGPNYIKYAAQRPGTSKGSLRPGSEGGNYVHFDSWDNAAKDYTRVLRKDSGLGKPLEAPNITDYVARLIKNGYMANSTGYLKTMKGVLNLLTPHIDVATLIKKKTRYSSPIDRIYAVLFGR